MISRSSLLFPALVAGIGISVAIGCGESPGEPDDSQVQTVVSENEVYAGEFVPEPAAPTTGDNSVSLSLTYQADDQPVTDADLAVEPWMPAHGHGAPDDEEPVVDESDDGNYEVTNIVYNMAGHWELRVEVDDGDDVDELVADFDVH